MADYGRIRPGVSCLFFCVFICWLTIALCKLLLIINMIAIGMHRYKNSGQYRYVDNYFNVMAYNNKCLILLLFVYFIK